LNKRYLHISLIFAVLAVIAFTGYLRPETEPKIPVRILFENSSNRVVFSHLLHSRAVQVQCIECHHHCNYGDGQDPIACKLCHPTANDANYKEIVMIFTTAMVLFGLGLSAAVILAAASKFLYVQEDPRIEDVKAVLPGANCGDCGYPGCANAAAAVVAGKAPVDVFIAGGNETAKQVAQIMDAEVTCKEPRIAEFHCTGGQRAEVLYLYECAHDCRAAAMLYGGGKQCTLGCLGLGSCTKVCPFDPIHMAADGLPRWGDFDNGADRSPVGF